MEMTWYFKWTEYLGRVCIGGTAIWVLHNFQPLEKFVDYMWYYIILFVIFSWIMLPVHRENDKVKSL